MGVAENPRGRVAPLRARELKFLGGLGLDSVGDVAPLRARELKFHASGAQVPTGAPWSRPYGRVS